MAERLFTVRIPDRERGEFYAAVNGQVVKGPTNTEVSLSLAELIVIATTGKNFEAQEADGTYTLVEARQFVEAMSMEASEDPDEEEPPIESTKVE